MYNIIVKTLQYVIKKKNTKCIFIYTLFKLKYSTIFQRLNHI